MPPIIPPACPYPWNAGPSFWKKVGAVGVTFGLDPSVRIVPSALTIGVITFSISFGGVAVGNLFGARWKGTAQVVGGVMLILVGLKILLEGLGILDLSI